MKASFFLTLLPAVLALPSEFKRSDASTTDRYLFDISLESFGSYRNARNPASLDWSSDNCSDSPDNPLGFPFTPGCQRHDFGYRNYKAQGRFTDAAKLRIDQNLRDDLYHQCDSTSHSTTCDGLANVYYATVRAFGRKAPLAENVIDEVAAKEYTMAVYAYNDAVKKENLDGQMDIVHVV